MIHIIFDRATTNINIRPSAGNLSMEIQDPALREKVDQIVQSLLGDVQWQ